MRKKVMDLRKYVSERHIFEEALVDFKQKYRKNSELTMSEYCAQERLNYNRYTRWLKSKGYSMATLKEEALSEVCPEVKVPIGGPEGMIVPLSASVPYSYSESFRMAEVEMPDGTHVTIRDFSVEELAVLLERCSALRKEEKPCTD